MCPAVLYYTLPDVTCLMPNFHCNAFIFIADASSPKLFDVNLFTSKEHCTEVLEFLFKQWYLLNKGSVVFNHSTYICFIKTEWGYSLQVHNFALNQCELYIFCACIFLSKQQKDIVYNFCYYNGYVHFFMATQLIWWTPDS